MQHINRLSREKSPYLLQHQHNPVDWFAWGEEAFSKSKKEGKPIFLSIGYSTCHWCHVMERECFEDEEVAEFLNQHFVSIKVDREERPDVDKIYMTAISAISGQSGWPLNAFLTTDLKPFFGGTYFPPEGFLKLLKGLTNLWRERRSSISQSSSDLHQRLSELCTASSDQNVCLSQSILHKAADAFSREYDRIDGGFGKAPKFPRPSFPSFLLQYGVRNERNEIVEMVLHTCKKMGRGGIYDHIGGGFSRYSVDSKWLIPHFEKMLYDNAQLIPLYLDAFLVSGDAFFSNIAEETLDYILRDMTHPLGGFFSAEDADSEGKEGKFYCWTKAELERLLEPCELEVAIRFFGITASGNFLDHSDPKALKDQNVISMSNNSSSNSSNDFDSLHLLKKAKAKMFEARSKRVRPHRDDKILVSWNGLMIVALARAFGVLKRKKDLEAATRCVDFIWKNLWNEKDSCLFHRWRDGQRDAVQLFHAYSYFLYGLVELYEVTLDPSYLLKTISVADAMIDRFYDSENGGFWQSEEKASDLILRLKEDYDGAEPSGNSVAILSLQKLAVICDRADYQKVIDHSLNAFAERMEQLPQSLPLMLSALDFSLDSPRRIVCQGNLQNPKLRSLLFAIHGVYQPNKVVIGTEGAVSPFVKKLNEMKRSKDQNDHDEMKRSKVSKVSKDQKDSNDHKVQNDHDEVCIFFCKGETCQKSTSETSQVAEFLSQS